MVSLVAFTVALTTSARGERKKNVNSDSIFFYIWASFDQIEKRTWNFRQFNRAGVAAKVRGGELWKSEKLKQHQKKKSQIIILWSQSHHCRSFIWSLVWLILFFFCNSFVCVFEFCYSRRIKSWKLFIVTWVDIPLWSIYESREDKNKFSISLKFEWFL